MKRVLSLVLALAMCLSCCALAAAETAAPGTFDGAGWIWLDSWENNQWVYLVKTLHLDTVPETATAHIAAVDKYTLYINGELAVLDGSLKRGLNPTDGWYDTVELAPYLQPGENLIALKVWYWGRRAEGTVSSHTFAAQPGLLFAADVGTERLVSDGSWAIYRETAYLSDSKSNPAPRSNLPEYNVCYDAGQALQGDWLTDAAISADWPRATVLADADTDLYGALHERMIPLFAFSELQDFPETAELVGHRTGKKEDITLHFPHNLQFTLYLKLEASRSRTITIQPDTYGQSKLGAKYITSDQGEQTYEFPVWLNGDSVTLSIPGGVTILDIKYRETRYHTQQAGAFSMGDDFYDTLWQMGVWTQLVCMRDSFMDCPDRERTQWWGDVTSQIQQAVYALDSDAWLLYEQGLAEKIGWLGYDKPDVLYTVVPSEEVIELPAQEMAGITGTWAYYLLTGREAVVEQMVDAYISYLRLWEVRDDGLVAVRVCDWSEYWGDNPWYDAYQTNIIPTLEGDKALVLENAWYYWACACVEQMAALTGRDASDLTARMDAIRAVYDAEFWTGHGYALGDAAPDERANAIAVLSGLASEDKYPAIRELLVSDYDTGTYMERYVLKALFDMGYTSEALDRMADRYGPMVAANLESGTTTLWEYWHRDSGTGNHAWTACPVDLLPAYVGGVRPITPGFETCLIAPDFSRTNTVAVSLETAYGTLAVSGTAAALTVTLPEGITATVRLPGGVEQVISGAGVHQVGE